MGITGSDVTKGVADVVSVATVDDCSSLRRSSVRSQVLADDNFATIVVAVREGRRIFDSITKFVMHLLSGNVAEAVLLMLSLAFVVDSDQRPVFVLSPLAILWINTATGSGPALGLAMDRPSLDIMSRPPIAHGIFTVRVCTAASRCRYTNRR